MKNTWKKIIIISLVIILLEAASLLFIAPYYRTYRVFAGIEDGKWQNVQTDYDKLSDRQKDRVQEHLDGYGMYLCERYIDGDMSYAELAASFDAINAIDATGQIMDKYMSDASYNEYKSIVKRINAAGASYDNSTLYSMQDSLRLVQQRMKNEDRESALIELLNDEYVVYLNGDITAAQMTAFASTVAGLSQYDAYNYSTILLSNVGAVEQYRQYYADAEALLQDSKYFDVITICRGVVLDEKDTVYRDKFDALYGEAYEDGRVYYGALLENYIAAGDNDSAVSLMDSIAAVYGDDYDLTDVKERLAEDWQLAYIECIQNIDTELASELSAFETGQYIITNEYDNLKPDSVVLYDIDENGVPEMFLYNSQHKDDDYIGCFIYTYADGEYKFVNFVNVASFCRDSNLIGFPIAFGRTAGDEYSLVAFDGASLTQVSYCQEIGGTYYVNGAESNDVDYLSARTSILSHADAYNVGNSKGANLADAETYILTFK